MDENWVLVGADLTFAGALSHRGALSPQLLPIEI
jgi:hypothetical protein